VTAGLRGVQLRRAVTGLLSFAAAEEQALLAADAFGPGSSGGSPDRWAAVPLVAHNNQFKSQQAERIGCLLNRRVPPAYQEIDHTSEEVYRSYLAQPPEVVLAGCRQVSAELADGTWALSDDDLLDPARHSWLNGRLLWLQIVVRGVWHPTGHLGDYYLARDQAGRAVAMQAQGLAMARYLGAPAAAAGMAGYNLACAQARAGQPDEAARTLAEAIEANPDLRANAHRDPDLEVLREAGP
jgi:tetratricopeptide (TPR) repeat protein